MLLVCALTLALSSVLLFPLVLEFGSQGVTRSIPFSYEQLAGHNIKLLNVAAVPFGNLYGDWSISGTVMTEHTYFTELSGLLFILCAFLFPFRRQSGLLVFFTAAVLFAFFLALGRSNPVYYLLYKYIPFFNVFRVPVRFINIFPLFIMWLSACGVGALELLVRKSRLCSEKMKKNFKIIALSFMFFCTIYFFIVLFMLRNPPPARMFLLIISAVLCFLVIFSVMHKGRVGGEKTFFLTALAASVLFTCALPILFVERAFITKNTDFMKEIEFLATVKKNLPTPYNKILYATNPTSAQIAQVSNIGDMGVLTLKAYKEYTYVAFNGKVADGETLRKLLYHHFHPLVVASISENEAGVWSALRFDKINWDKIYNVKMKDNPAYRMLCPTYTILYSKMYKDPRPFPRFFFSRRYRVVEDCGEILRIITAKDFDPNEQILLSAPPEPAYAGLLSREKPAVITPAVISHFEPDKVEITLNGQSGWLTLSDTYYPGWKVIVDGSPRPIYKGCGIFRTVPILPGEKKVVFIYCAPAQKTGLLISISAFLVILITIIILKLKRR